jgi:thiosulfate dehydrogenase [quinone] large subunit
VAERTAVPKTAPRAERRPQRPSAPPLDWSPVLTTTTIPGIFILPLRIFLGVTFVYAGLQKINDPGFFTLGSPTYIGTQLRNFGHGSPISFFMNRLLEHAVAVGWLTIFTEIVIGLLVLFGLFTRGAALVGLTLNLVFFLTASWHVYPYFLGADIVFVMAWMTLALTGPGGYDLDAVAAPRLIPILPFGLAHLLFASPQHELPPRAVPQTDLDAAVSGNGATAPAPVSPAARQARGVTRGEALIAGAATGFLLLLGLSPKGSLINAAPAASPQPAAAPQPTAAPGAAPAATPTPVPPSGGKVVGNTSQIAVNSALATTDPKSGDPAVVVHTPGGQFVAYDAVCTHAGCTVQYDPSYKLLVCPCHGGAFDPAQNAQVVAGPPPAPLTALPIHIDSKGNISLA